MHDPLESGSLYCVVPWASSILTSEPTVKLKWISLHCPSIDGLNELAFSWRQASALSYEQPDAAYTLQSCSV